jgi:HEAT repeat protein
VPSWRKAKKLAGAVAELADPRRGVHAQDRLARRGRAAVVPLLAACQSPDPVVRFRATNALGQIGDLRAYETLLGLVEDPDKQVRYDAVMALGYLGDPRAVPLLLDLVRQSPRPDHLDHAAANSLDRIGSPAVAGLCELLASGSTPARSLAAYTLGAIGDPVAIEPLALLLSNPALELRAAALDALAEIGGERCLHLIEQRLEDPEEDVRRTATYWSAELRRELGLGPH